MPFFSFTSLLSLDLEAWAQRFKALFECTHKLVFFDSTLRRVLEWLNPGQLRRMLLALLPRLETGATLRRYSGT